MAETMRGVLDRVATLPVPVLAAVNGDAYGGGAEVAVACDIRIAADDVRCAFNQVALGIMPAWGGIERLTALVGRGRALALMTTGRVLDAAAALDAGPLRRGGAARRTSTSAGVRWRPRSRARHGTRSWASRPRSAPRSRPRDRSSRADAIESFARTWIAETHWKMVEEAEQRRRAARERS